MNKAWRRFEQLAASARNQTAPPIDVTTDVLAAITRRRAATARPRLWNEWRWELAGGAALTTAAAVLFAVWSAYYSSTELMVELLRPILTLLG